MGFGTVWGATLGPAVEGATTEVGVETKLAMDATTGEPEDGPDKLPWGESTTGGPANGSDILPWGEATRGEPWGEATRGEPWGEAISGEPAQSSSEGRPDRLPWEEATKSDSESPVTIRRTS